MLTSRSRYFNLRFSRYLAECGECCTQLPCLIYLQSPSSVMWNHDLFVRITMFSFSRCFGFLLSLWSACNAANTLPNSTFTNPILPGFHPDPSCIFVPEWNNTFFCASSSFEAFPGIPIHASKDLQNWKLVSNALNRPEQLPALSITNKSTSGIWAPALRYHEGTFYILTTLVFDDRDAADSSRWDNMIFKSADPMSSSSWSDPVHFNFTGYDTSPFWDEE